MAGVEHALGHRAEHGDTDSLSQRAEERHQSRDHPALIPVHALLHRHRFSAFVGTSLDIVLRTLGVRSLLVTGVATEVCVESTLRDGLSAEYAVSLVEDCAATYT